MVSRGLLNSFVRSCPLLKYVTVDLLNVEGLPGPIRNGGCVCTDGTIKGHRNAIVSFSRGVVSDEVSNSETKLREASWLAPCQGCQDGHLRKLGERCCEYGRWSCGPSQLHVPSVRSGPGGANGGSPPAHPARLPKVVPRPVPPACSHLLSCARQRMTCSFVSVWQDVCVCIKGKSARKLQSVWGSAAVGVLAKQFMG